MDVVDANSRNGVLIAEDQEEIRSLLALVLEMEGFAVYQAADGMEALQVFELHRDDIDLLITDLGLPKLGGVELISKLRALKPGIRIIGSSGYGRINVRDEVLAAGGDEFVSKPFVAADLVKRAKELLGARESGKEQTHQ